MPRLEICREITIPDPQKAERCRLAPAFGPSILFFSGGSALRRTSQLLTQYTHNSIHVITPFDSGGSSAILRQAFAMPAVGDIRNRLMALADQSLKGNPEIRELFAYRLPQNVSRQELQTELSLLALGKHRLIRLIPDPMRKIIRNYFYQFIDLMPDGFDLRGASLGNVVLTAGYLTNKRHIDPVIYLFSKLVEVRGIVRPTVNDDGQLAVRHQDGTITVGQHRFTGKENGPITSPIEDIWLTQDQTTTAPAMFRIRETMRDLIRTADIICYPMGSFYSSLIANLLPRGVGATVAAMRCPKVYIPNTGDDPEALGHDLNTLVNKLLHYLRKDAPDNIRPSDVLNVIIIDSKCGKYHGTLDIDMVQKLGIHVVDTPLVSERSAPFIDAELLIPVLLSLC